MSVLPTWRGPRDGSGCDNDDCPATDRWVTIASRREIDLIFPRKDKLSFWPLPDQATHVCTSCGFIYQDVAPDTTFDAVENDDVTYDITEFDFDLDAVHDEPIRTVAESFIEGAPEDVTVSQLADGIARYVPGVDHAFARELLTEDDTETDS